VKKKAVFFILLITSWSLCAKTLILPFRTPDADTLSWQWLGRGISHYLIVGLESNAVPVFSPEEADYILREHHIAFPFSMSKAVALHLAKKYGADGLLWGELLPVINEPGKVVIKAFLINTANWRQYHLPLLKGEVENLENVKFELLSCARRQINGDSAVKRPASLQISPHQYEIFIKSLLATDKERRLEMILSAVALNPDSQILAFAAARFLYEKGDFDKAETFLEKTSLSDPEVILLQAAIREKKADIIGAREILHKLLNADQYSRYAGNNLGALEIRSGFPEKAKKILAKSLEERFSPDVSFNLALANFLEGAQEEAMRIVVETLRIQPGHKELLGLLDLLVKGERKENDPPKTDTGYAPKPLDIFPFKVDWLPANNDEEAPFKDITAPSKNKEIK